MPAKKKKTWDSYQDYLKSPEWASIRKQVHERDRTCRICFSEENLHCHHWKYSSNWNNDSSDNVILMCEECHSTHHEVVDPDNFGHDSNWHCIAKHLQLTSVTNEYEMLKLSIAEIVESCSIKITREVFPSKVILVGGVQLTPLESRYIIDYLKSRGRVDA